MFKIASVVGARPQFVKLAPLLQAISDYNRTAADPLTHLTIHTGQHYNADMSDIFFEELEIPSAEINLGVGSGTHGKQTAKMLAGIEEILLREKPDLMIIFGDTNSTLAGALAAAKLHIPIAHVEAGLRSFNRQMPEEINRIASDHLSDVLLAPTNTAVENLEREGLGEKTVLTGDIMYDTVLRNARLAGRKSRIRQKLQLRERAYYLATVHRAENTDDPEKLLAILNELNDIAAENYPVVLPMHPRTAHAIKRFLPYWSAHPQFRIISPVGYLDMLQLIETARLAITDSGGLQKEVFFLNCPCITLREETEWLETVTAGGNILTGADGEKIRQAFRHWEKNLAIGPVDYSAPVRAHFGDGKASEKILRTILNFSTKHKSL